MENEKSKTIKDYRFLGNDDPENVISHSHPSLQIEMASKNEIEMAKIIDLDNNQNINNFDNELINGRKNFFINFQKFMKKIFCYKFIKFVYGLFLSFAWISLYIISLEGCDKQQAECLTTQNHSTVIKVGKFIFSSAICFTLLIVFTLLKFTFNYFIYFSVIFKIYLFYFYDTGADFAHHGSYNRVFFYLFFVILLFVSLTIYLFFMSIIKFPFRTILVVSLSVFIIYYKINEFVYTSCDYWNKGFKDSKIRNDIGYCKIFTPSNVCFLIVTNNLFDVTSLRGLNCAKDRNYFEEKNLLKTYLPEELKKAKRLGFPRTEKWNFFPESTLAYFNKNIFKSMIDMDNKDPEISGEPISEKNKKINETEVYIDFSKEDSYPEVVISLKKNETLIKERTEKAEMHKNQTLFKNVIFIYLDALSRNHFRRKLPKTFSWLEQFYDNSMWEANNQEAENEKNQKDNENIYCKYSSYQFLKYHAVDYYTFANMIPGYFGVHKWDQKGTYYLYDYKEAGYITGQSTNVCEREGWDLEMAFEPYLNYTNYDHEFNAFYCDPNFSDPDSPYQFLKGAYSVIRKCMYGKDSGEFQIEYAKQFFDAYKDQNKIYRMIFSDAHEGTLEVVKYLDDMIHDFFEYLLIKGHLENSILMVMSDHGISLPGPAYLTQAKDWYSEVFLPSLFFVIPKDHEQFKNMDENLKNNENKWITSFDINSSLRSFANKTNSYIEWGQSLVMETIDENYRSCGFYRMQGGYCLCNWQP